MTYESYLDDTKRLLSYETEVVIQELDKFAWVSFAKSILFPFCN